MSLKEYTIQIDSNTFILTGNSIEYLNKVTSGMLFRELDDVIMMVNNVEAPFDIYILTTPAVLDYLIKFHNFEFTQDFIGGVPFYTMDYTTHKRIIFYI